MSEDPAGDSDGQDRRGRGGAWQRLRTGVFGDGWGVALFLGTLGLMFCLWRVGFFIADTRTIANALVNVANGQLAVEQTPYSLTFGSQPGLVTDGTVAYGRNYGQILVTAPLLFGAQLAGLIVDPRLLLAALLSLVVIGTTREVALASERDRIATIGRPVAIAVFVLALVPATTLPADRLPIIALQAATALAFAAAAVAIYRLVALHGSRRLGLAAGTCLVVASPLAFWATIPKRHVFTGAVMAVGLYWFARSRDPGLAHRVRYRAGPYVLVGLLASVHAFEAAYLMLVLVPIDLWTAPSNRPRDLAKVGGLTVLALLPALVLNSLISGNPFKPPRAMEQVQVGEGLPDGLGTDFPDPGGDAGGEGGGGGATNGGTSGGSGGPATGEGGEGAGGQGLPQPLAGVVATATRGLGFVAVVVWFLIDSFWQGIEQLGQFGQLQATFLRSGFIGDVLQANEYEAIDLALLETMPLLAGVLWVPIAWTRRLLDRQVRWKPSPVGATDLLAVGWTVVFVVVYLPYLPLVSQITVRYIVPITPLVIYGLARLAPLAAAVRSAARWLVGSYLLSAVGGTVLITVVLSVLDPAVGEAMQFHALVNLGAAGLLGAAVLTWPLLDRDHVVAVAAGIAAGLTTAFLLLTALEYFRYGPYAIDLVRWLAAPIDIL